MKGSLHQIVRVAHLIDPAVNAAAGEVQSVGLDCQGYDEALFIVTCGVITATGDVLVHLEESDDNGVADAYADIALAIIPDTVLTVALDQTEHLIHVDLAKRKRWIRVCHDVDDDAATFGIIALLGSPKYLPITQVNAVISV